MDSYFDSFDKNVKCKVRRPLLDNHAYCQWQIRQYEWTHPSTGIQHTAVFVNEKCRHSLAYLLIYRTIWTSEVFFTHNA